MSRWFTAAPCADCGSTVVTRLGYCQGCGVYRRQYDQDLMPVRPRPQPSAEPLPADLHDELVPRGFIH